MHAPPKGMRRALVAAPQGQSCNLQARACLRQHTAAAQVKAKLCAYAVDHGNDGVRLVAVKFLELAVLLLTADLPRPHALLQPSMVTQPPALSRHECRPHVHTYKYHVAAVCQGGA